MPITKIFIENFKGIGERVEIPLRPITLLFGANSAGKSTILQSLLYMRELLERQNADADHLLASGASIDLGGFQKFVHKHDLKRKVRIGIEISLDADGLPIHERYFSQGLSSLIYATRLSDCLSASVEIEVAWDTNSSRPWITGYHIGIDGRHIGSIEAVPEKKGELTFFDLDHPILAPDEGADEILLDHEYSPIYDILSGLNSEFINEAPRWNVPLESGVIPKRGEGIWLGTDASEDEDLELKLTQYCLQRIFVGSGDLALKELERIRHIGAFRDIPDRQFSFRRSPSEDRWANGAAAWDLLHRGNTPWLKKEAIDSLGLGYSIERQEYYEIPVDGATGAFLTKAIFEMLDDEGMTLDVKELWDINFETAKLPKISRIHLLDSNSGAKVGLSDVGVGVSQVIPVVVGAMAPGYSVLSVEQPELHIHPAVQCALADVLAHQVTGVSDRRILLETHSEHIMLRLLRRIRELNDEELPPGAPKIKPDDLSVLYIESTESGQTITPLPITADGDFSRKWPKGFFEEREEELF